MNRFRCAAAIALLPICAVVLLGTRLNAAPDHAARTGGDAAEPEIQRVYAYRNWHLAETQNFQVCSLSSGSVAARAALTCEKLRASLLAKWLPQATTEPWSARCQIVLHATQQTYLAEVGAAGAKTVGSSDVRIKQGRVHARRIDLRADQPDFMTAALPHELTHVVLADRFAAAPLPFWAEEGIAIQADPREKQDRHARDLHAAVNSRSLFHAAELLKLDGYPAKDRWGAFYGQSASVVQFLLERGTPGQLLDFLDRARASGYDAALREQYGVANVGELDRLWRAQVTLAAYRRE